MCLRTLIAAATLALASPSLADPAIGKRVDAVFADDTVTLTEAGRTVLVYRTKPINPATEPGRATMRITETNASGIIGKA